VVILGRLGRSLVTRKLSKLALAARVVKVGLMTALTKDLPLTER
jgi:hypothetical protein